jgi:hypothetical protein
VLVQYFGLGEVTGNIKVLPTRLHDLEDGPQARIGSCGYERTAMQVQIQDNPGCELKPFETGEICVIGAAVFAGRSGRRRLFSCARTQVAQSITFNQLNSTDFPSRGASTRQPVSSVRSSRSSATTTTELVLFAARLAVSKTRSSSSLRIVTFAMCVFPNKATESLSII